MKATLRLFFAYALVSWTLSATAGGPLSVSSGGVPCKYSGPGTVALNYDQGALSAFSWGDSKAKADALVSAAVVNWTNVTTATVAINRGADLPVDVTTANAATYLGAPNSFTPSVFQDGINPVIYDPNGSITDMYLGTGASNGVLGFAGSAFSTGSGTCTYLEGRAIINGSINVHPDPTAAATIMRVTIAHEIGHLIGMDHSQINSEQGVSSSSRPLMYPIASRNTDALHEDDVAAVTALYPGSNVGTVYGELSGTFRLANGSTPIRGANIWAREVTTGRVYSVVSDYLEQNTGFYRLLLPAGTYNLRAGAINAGFTEGSSVGPYAQNSSDLSFQAPMYNGGTPMTAVAYGGASPHSIVIVPGCAAVTNFRIDGTGTISSNCVGPTTYALTVTKGGTGGGTVASNVGGINCGATCSANLNQGTAVTLTATPAGGSVFTGWGGACSGAGQCSVTMNAARSVTATFETASTITVNKAGAGAGTVTSSVGGVNCGATCLATLPTGTPVTLTATPHSGSVFAGWSGACSGTSTCNVTLSVNRTVTASFNANYTGTLVTRYRLYSPGTSEHLYTTDANEYSVLPNCCAWIPEGAIYKLFAGPGSFGGVSAVPYYRLYNPFSFQHHWTTDANEYSILPTLGWQQEGIDGYILPTQAPGTVPLYRLYLNALGGLHLWTTDLNERNVLTASQGWVGEGIAGYVLPLP